MIMVEKCVGLRFNIGFGYTYLSQDEVKIQVSWSQLVQFASFDVIEPFTEHVNSLRVKWFFIYVCKLKKKN